MTTTMVIAEQSSGLRDVLRNATRLVLAAVLTATTVIAAAETLRPAGTAGVQFERRFFGLHMHQPERIKWPAVRFGTWRLWDTGISWADMEPQPGRYDFTKLDRYLDLAKRHDVEVVLPIASTPAWASSRPREPSPFGPGRAAPPVDLATWNQFVDELVKHTSGKVRAYELWNEANIAMFYTGDVATLVDMARGLHAAVRKHAPSALVVGPSGAGLLDSRRQFLANFVAAGGGQWVDVLSFHLYTGPHPPEVMVDKVQDLMAAARKVGPRGVPLWNTESGYQARADRNGRGSKSQDAHAADRTAAYVVRAHIIARALGVEQFDVYSWDNGKNQFVDEDNATLTGIGTAYSAMTNLLVGTTLQDCEVQLKGVSTCRLVSPRFGPFTLAWTAGGTTTNWRPNGRVNVATLEGKSLQSSVDSVMLDEMPVVVTPPGVTVALDR